MLDTPIQPAVTVITPSHALRRILIMFTGVLAGVALCLLFASAVFAPRLFGHKKCGCGHDRAPRSEHRTIERHAMTHVHVTPWRTPCHRSA